MNDLTISIVSYNNYDDINLLVESIEKYTNKNIKKIIYIIDNADERDKFRVLSSKYADIKYLYTGKNLGFGTGHNYVLELLNSKYHAIVNPDILLNEDTFEKLIRFMEEERSIGMCIPRLIDENGEILQVYRREVTVIDMFIRMFCKKIFPKRMRYHSLQDQNYEEVFDVPFGQGSFLFIRTKLYKEIKGFDDRYFMYMEDADLCKRVNQISRFVYCPYTTVVHKWEQGSHKSMKLFRIHLKSMFLYFKKWRKSR